MNGIGRALVFAGITLVASTACKPDPAAVHRDKGGELADKSDWKGAAQEYDLSLKADPNQGSVWEQKAYAHMQLQEFDQVEVAMLKVAELKHDKAKIAETYRNLGGMYYQHDMLDKAEPMFMKAVEIDPKDDQSLSWLAEIYSREGGARVQGAPAVPKFLDKASQYYDKVIAVKPELPNTYINKRIVMMKFMDYELGQKATILGQAAQEKDKAKVRDLQGSAADHQAKYDDYKKQFDDMTRRFTEAQKASANQGG